MKKIVILTGSELRHTFFRKFLGLSDDIYIINSYCEDVDPTIKAILTSEDKNSLRTKHLINREQSEKDFFGLFVSSVPDNSRPIFLPKGAINSQPYIDRIIQSKPDLLVAYGCSLVKGPLLNIFNRRFLNVHLGLSPYYRGSGTNYWALVNNEPEYVGATFMYMDAGVDTGEIIHQIRARVVWGDTPSSIGNRLIIDMAYVYREIIRRFDILQKMEQLPKPYRERVYRKMDFSEESVAILYNNFANGLVEKYLSQQEERCRKVPIICNPALREVEIV